MSFALSPISDNFSYDLYSIVKNMPTSRIALLANASLQYSTTNTSFPSESFPGLSAIVTGASPKTHGFWYKNTYSRELYPPGSNCIGPKGTSVIYDESVSVNATSPDGGCPGFKCACPSALWFLKSFIVQDSAHGHHLKVFEYDSVNHLVLL